MGFNRDNARTGVEGIEASKQSGKGDSYTPMLTWGAGEKKFIKFITPLEEVPTVDFYPFMIVGHNDNNKPIYRSFISPCDPGVEGHETNTDYLRQRGVTPKKRQIAVAVELEPIVEDKARGKKEIKGWNVVEREFSRQDGTEVTVPNVGLIIQSHIFFGPLAVYAEDEVVEDLVWEVVRQGGDQNTAYVFRDRGEAPEVDLGDEVPDLDAYLDELSSEERMREHVEHQPSDWVFDMYANKGKGKPSGSRTRAAESLDTTAPEQQDFDNLRSAVASRRSAKASS